MSSLKVIRDCITATETSIKKAENSFSHLSETQINWKPQADKWSVGECISHLVNTNRLYLTKIENVFASVSYGEEKDFPYKQSLFGKLIAKGVDPKSVRKTKTFKIFFPAPSSIQKNIIDEYVGTSKKLIELIQKLRTLDLKKYKLSSPANRLVSLNLGDPLIIISLHDERHLNQAERVLNQKEFPTL